MRRPKQQSTDWIPPSKNNKAKEIPPKVLSVKSKSTNSENKKSLRPPRQQRNVTDEQNKIIPAAAKKEEKMSSKKLLSQYFEKNNLGEPSYKIAVMGREGKERFLATITVQQTQYKTYPDTFQTRQQAEEAVSGLALHKLGETEMETFSPTD